jgi:hypothetical protein
MVVSRNNDVQCTCGRLGSLDPQAAAYGEACGGTPASEGTGGVTPGELAIGFSQPPFPRPAPQITSEALPYCILRRMSTDSPKKVYLYEFRQLGSAVLTSSPKYLSDNQELFDYLEREDLHR